MCFSLSWLLSVLIWLIVIGAVIAIVKIILPPILANFGAPGVMAVQILTIIMWAIFMVALVIFAFQMISCLLGSGGGIGFPSLHR